MLKLLEHFPVRSVWWFRRIEHPVKMLDHLQRVFVGRIAMEELVLHQARQLSELRQESSQQLDLVHHAQDPGDLSFLLQNGKQSVARLRRALKAARDELEILANETFQFRAQFYAALL